MQKELLPIDPSTVVLGYVFDNRPAWRNAVYSPIAKDRDGKWCISPFYIRKQVLDRSCFEEGIDHILSAQEVRKKLASLKTTDPTANRYVLGVAVRVLNWAEFRLDFMNNSLGIWEPIEPGCGVGIIGANTWGGLVSSLVRS